MNKNDLIAAVADSTGTSKSDAGSAVDATFYTITNALKSGDSVQLVGSGISVSLTALLGRVGTPGLALLSR